MCIRDSLRQIAEQYYPGTYYLAGESVSTYDLMDTITADMKKVNFIAIGAVFLVLLLSFQSLVLPIILVLCLSLIHILFLPATVRTSSGRWSMLCCVVTRRNRTEFYRRAAVLCCGRKIVLCCGSIAG